MVGEKGVEPLRISTLDPKASIFQKRTDSEISALQRVSASDHIFHNEMLRVCKYLQLRLFQRQQNKKFGGTKGAAMVS